MALCAQEVSHHAASLLACLNRQREQAQFCDCVLKHKQSSGQLYPAHKCLLAASSPVLASILPSTGALVELQDPCLADSVLAILLDYIYTGALPVTHTQQQHYRLLTAACHLQMKELQEALMAAWQQTEMNATDDVSASARAEIHPYNSINNSYRSYLKESFRDPPSYPITDVFERFEETNNFCSTRATTCDETSMNSASMDSCVKAGEIWTDKNIMNCRRTDASTLENNANMNVSEYRHVLYSTEQNPVQDTGDTAEVDDVSEGNKEVDVDQYRSGGFIKPEIWKRNAKEELLLTSEDKKSSSSSTLPHPCCGAVPVICHGSRAAVHQLAEECAAPAYHPPFQSSVSSSRSPVLRPVSTDNDNTMDCMTTKQKDRLGSQNLDLRYNEKYIVCTTRLQLNQDYNNSNRNNFLISNNRCIANSLSPITNHNDQSAQFDSFRSNIKHLTEDVVVQNKDWSRDDFHSTSQYFDCFECRTASVSKAEKHSQDWRAVDPLLLEDSDSGSESHCDDVCHEVEAKEEHSYCSRRPTEMGLQDVCGPDTSWYPNMCTPEQSRKDASFREHERESDSRHTASEQRHRLDLCLPVSTMREPGLDNIAGSLSSTECITVQKSKKNSGTKTTEACLTSITPENKRTYDAACTVSHSYDYHLHSHCPPQDTHITHRPAEHKHSQPGCSHLSAELSDGDKADSFCPKEITFLKETTEQVLLVDTNIKPAAAKRRSDMEDKGIKSDRVESAIRNEGPSVTWTEKKKIRKRSKFEGEDSHENKEQTKVQRNSLHKDQSRTGTKHRQKTVAVEVSNPNEDESEITPWPGCSTLCEPESIQACVPSTLSACIPSTLPDSTPKDRPSHLSSPTHQPFQCSLCDRSFSQRGSLNRHVRSHLGVRPFPCPRCPMTFSRQYRVTEHMRVHQRCALGNDLQKSNDSSIRDENRPHS